MSIKTLGNIIVVIGGAGMYLSVVFPIVTTAITMLGKASILSGMGEYIFIGAIICLFVSAPIMMRGFYLRDVGKDIEEKRKQKD